MSAVNLLTVMTESCILASDAISLLLDLCSPLSVLCLRSGNSLMNWNGVRIVSTKEYIETDLGVELVDDVEG